PPEEAPHLAHTQRPPSPRETLKAVKLLRGAPGKIVFNGAAGQVRGPESRQQRIGPHDQRDMAIPSRPTPHFILIQPDVAFGLFETPCNGPSAAGDLHHRCQPRRLRGKHHVRCELRRVVQTPAYPKPPTPVRLQRRGQGEPPPVIPAWAFRPI